MMNPDIRVSLMQPGAQSAMNQKSESISPESTVYIPPTGQWKDHLCNCFENLWPSCCCVALGGYTGGCLPMFLAGQISTRLGWFDTKSVIISYTLAIIVFFVIALVVIASIVQGQGAAVIIFYVPYAGALAFLVMLRYKFVAQFQIPEGDFETCCAGFWCAPCSLCQMARHLYGYKKQFDGDGFLDGNMQYSSAEAV